MDPLQRSKEILSKKLQEAVAEVDFDSARNLLREWSGFMETFNAIKALPGGEPCRELVAGMRVLSECTTSCLNDAVQQRQFPMVDLLLKHAADVNAVDQGGSTPVLAAAMSTDETMLKLLLRHSADVNMRINKAEVTALHHVVILGLYPSARFLLEYGADVSVADKFGCTPLHLAALHNMLEIARLLLQYGADCNYATEATHSTCYSPMHIAVVKGNAAMVRLFLEHGAEVGAVIGHSDWTLLMSAAWLGHEEVVELLLEHGADAIARNKEDQTPLHLAVSMGHLGVVRVLQKHLSLLDAKDKTGSTPLHVAARCGNEKIVEDLALEGENLDQIDKRLRTPLHVAVENNHLHVLEALLQAGAAYNTRDHEGKTPLFTAALLGHQEIVEMLLEMDQVNREFSAAKRKEILPDAAQPAQICPTSTEPPTLEMEESGFGGLTHLPNNIPARISSDLRDRLAISTSEVIKLDSEVQGDFPKTSESHSTHLPLRRDLTGDKRRQLFHHQQQRNALLNDQLSATPTLQRPLKSAGQSDPASLEFATLGREEILQATNNFREGNVVGRGGFAVVYAGVLHGMPVAVKRLKIRAVKDAVEMLNREVEVLRNLRHKHVIRLYGWCPTEMSMVYELCEGGALSNRLSSLTWQQRLRILTEVADALSELHQRQPQAVVHRDVKPSNVLLDANLAAKLSDLGLACQMPARTRKEATAAAQAMYTRDLAGTKGHMDPEYVSTGWVGPASDVYSFGVMIMQVIKGIRKVNPGSFLCDLNELERHLDSEKLATMLDERAGEWPEELAVSLVQLMIQCCECRRRRRPGMGEKVLPELRHLHLLAQDASPDHALHPRGSVGAESMKSGSQKGLLTRVLKGSVHSRSQTNSPPPEIDSFAAEARNMSKCHEQQQQKQAQAATFFKWTKLHQACWQGNPEEVVQLVEGGADVHAVDKMGYTPLHWAAYSGSVKTVQKLLEYGADGSRTDKSRRTPLDIAAQENHVEVVQILVQNNVTIDNITMDGLNALDTAALLGNKETVELLEKVRRKNSYSSDPEVLSSPGYPGSPQHDNVLQGAGATGWHHEGAVAYAAMERVAHHDELPASPSAAIAPFTFLAFQRDNILQATRNFDPDLILCEGTFSTTFKGSIQQHPVAIKIFDKSEETDQVDTVRMMHQEAEALRGIRHNHLTRIYGWCPEEMALVYEPWVGRTLLEQMSELHWRDRARVAYEVAMGLNALHHRRPQAVVHRDLQPGAIFCGSTNTTKLSELGLSTLMPEQLRSQSLGDKLGQAAQRDLEAWSEVKVHDEELVGTPGYMDPEYVATGWVSPSSDVYSLGVIMLEMLMGAVGNLTPASVTHRLNKLEEAMEVNSVHEITDKTAGEWPVEHAHRFAKLVVSCCEARQRQRPHLEQEVIPMLAGLEDIAK